MLLASQSVARTTVPTPPPPPPPGAGFQRVAQEISSRIDSLSLARAGVLAEATVRSGRTAAEAVSAWNAAYGISSVNQAEATVYAVITMHSGAAPNAFVNAYNAAYGVQPISSNEALDLATRMVLRGYDPANFSKTFDRLYSMDEVSATTAEALSKAAVSANATVDQVVDAYTWYRSQPGGDQAQARQWTVDHLAQQAGGFDAHHDQMLAEVRARVEAAR